MAATALRPLAVTFMELLAGTDCEVEEFRLSADPERLGELNGRSLTELELRRRTGALVLAIRNPEPDLRNPYLYRGSSYTPDEPSLLANPGGEVTLAPGQLLVVMGSQAQLAAFAALLGRALVSIDAMRE
jgi:voltage-gated potassium channel